MERYIRIYRHDSIPKTNPEVCFSYQVSIEQHSYTIGNLTPNKNYSFRLINMYEHGEGHSCGIFFTTKKAGKFSYIPIILNIGGILLSRFFNVFLNTPNKKKKKIKTSNFLKCIDHRLISVFPEQTLHEIP